MNHGEQEKPIRLFIAIDLPTALRHRIESLQRELKKQLPTGPIRWVAPSQIHLTLRFLGEVPSEAVRGLQEALGRAAAPLAKFELTAQGLGCFPSPNRPRVIWVGVTGQVQALGELQANVERETACWGKREEHAFHPHLTLGRVKNLSGPEVQAFKDRLSAAPSDPLGTWEVTRLSLIRSQLTPAGAHHQELAAASLDIALRSGLC